MIPKKRREKKSLFIPKLHQILAEIGTGIRWLEDEKSFSIYDFRVFVKHTLPLYFRHSNVSSFIRQLNLYGFDRIIDESTPEGSYKCPEFEKGSFKELKPLKSQYNKVKYAKDSEDQSDGEVLLPQKMASSLEVIKETDRQQESRDQIKVQAQKSEEKDELIRLRKQNKHLRAQNSLLRGIQAQYNLMKQKRIIQSPNRNIPEAKWPEQSFLNTSEAHSMCKVERSPVTILYPKGQVNSQQIVNPIFNLPYQQQLMSFQVNEQPNQIHRYANAMNFCFFEI